MAGVRQFNEDDTFTEALALFSVKGFRATSMLDLAEATGVQRGSLYHAYGDKEEIFIRVFERYSTRFVEDARAILGTGNVRAALTAFFAFVIHTITQGDPANGCLSTRTAVEINPDSPRLRQALQDMLDGLEAVVVSAFDNHEARTQLSLSPRRAANLIVTMTRGIAVMERIYGDPRRLRQSASALIDTLAPKQ